MMKRRSLPFIPAVLLALAGLASWLIFRLGWLPDYILYLRASLGILLLVAGVLLAFLYTAGLLTILKLMQRFRMQLADAQAKKTKKHSQFLRRLDHELKNPLTAMQIEVGNFETEINHIENASLDEPLSIVERTMAVQRLKHQVMRMNDLVLQLRKLGELESHPLDREPIRLDEMLNDLVEEFQASEEGARRAITLSLPQIPWPLAEIEGDSDLVYLALRNVLGNAVKFSRPGDAIQVRAYEDMPQVIVEVADQGPGIPADELPYVWEELYRGKQAHGLPGSGLGLAIVKAIILRHGGEVALRSRMNQGTVVIIRLPARV